MSDPEFMKEYLREAFMAGALDLGHDKKFLEGFLRIFAGEMEATIALDLASYLSKEEQIRMLKLAKPTNESVAHHLAWDRRIRRSTRRNLDQ